MLFPFFFFLFLNLRYQNGGRKKIWPVTGVAIVTWKCVYFICFHERRNKKMIKSSPVVPQSSRLVFVTLKNDYDLVFALWTVFKYLFFWVFVFLSCYPVWIMVTFSRLSVSVMTSQKNGPCFISDSIPSLFLFVCLFLYILAVSEWQNILNVSHYVAVAQETEIIAMIIIKKKNMTKMIRAPFTWWSSVLLYCHPWGRKKKRKKKLFLSWIIFTTFCTNGTILCVCSHNHYYLMYLYIAGFASMCARRKNIYKYIHVSNGDASYTAPKYKYKTPKH